MSFPDLHEFVQGQFAEFAGTDAYETQLTIWCHLRHQAKKQWRADNPEKARSSHRAWVASNRVADKLAHKRWNAANPDKVKARNGRYYRANKERLKAEARAKYAMSLSAPANADTGRDKTQKERAA